MKIGKFKKIAAIGLALTMAIGLLYSSPKVQAVDNAPFETKNRVDAEGLVTDKTATWNDYTKQYDIKLESYVTGTIDTGEKSVPTDIALVLDASGSMDDYIVVGNKNDTSQLDKKYGGEEGFYRLSILGGEVLTFKVRYNNSTQKWEYFEGAFGIGEWKSLEEFDLGIGGQVMITKENALKLSAKNFIDSVYNQSIENNVDHRISIITFESRSDIKCTNLSVKDNADLLKRYIDGLYANGATRADLGMTNAANILVNTENDSNKVAVLFTDGEPTTSNTFNSTVANNTIEQSKRIKEIGGKVYSVGVFEEANPNDTSSNFNKYMHGVSSNYPNANSINNLGEGGNNGYYMAATTAEGLNDIFEKISEDISNPSIELDTRATVYDKLSDYFSFPKGFDKNNIKVYYENAVSFENGEYTFDGQEHSFVDGGLAIPTVAYDEKDNSIKVNGFDYSADGNFVAKDESNGNVSGKKLVIEFSVKPKDGFIGGNAVPTNSSISGVYTNNDVGTLIEQFIEPKVDVDINYNAMLNDAAMYAGDNWKDFYRFFNEVGDGIHYNIGSGNYTIDGSNNKYVDIEYQIKDGDEVIATYTINAGEIKFDKDINIGDTYLQNVQKFDKDHKYTISVNVRPSEDAIDDDLDNITIDEYQTQNDNKTLYLYVPHIKTIDKKVMVDTEVDLDDDEIIKLMGWNSKTEDDNLPQPSYNGEFNKEPDLNYTIKGPVTNSGSEYPNIETFTPTKDGKYIFEYIVENARNSGDLIDITDVSQHQNSCNIEPPCYKEDDNMFAIHVISGKITVIKNIDETDLEVNPTDGDPIFTFKLEKIANGKPVNTIYKTIKVNETNGQWTAQFDFDSLGEGTYKVTELETMRYEQISVTNNGQVAINVENLDHKILFTNIVKSDDYFTDNDIVVNKFVIGDDGQITVERDYLN